MKYFKPKSKKQRILTYSILFLVLLSLSTFIYVKYVYAANAVWNNSTGDGKWSTCANWTGGTGTEGCPGTNDTATFNSTNITNVTIDTNVDVKGINIVGNQGGIYSGTITQNSGITVTVRASGFTMNTGTTATFIGSNSAITIASGSFTINGGTFIGGSGSISLVNTSFSQDGGIFNNTSGGLDIERNFTITGGTFNNDGKTVTFSDTNTADDTTVTYTGGVVEGTVVVTKDNGGDFSVASGTTINLGSNPTIGINSSATTPFTNNGTIIVPSGTWTVAGATAGGTTLTNNGTIIHAGSGWDFNDASLTNTGTITYSGISITIDRNLTQNGTFNLAGKTITFDDSNNANDDSTIIANSAIEGNITISKQAGGADTTIGSNLTVLGDFTANNKITDSASVYILTIQGNLSVTSSYTFGGTSLTVVMGGAGTQTISRIGVAIDSPFQINKTGGTASLGSAFTVTGQACTITAGTFDLAGQNFTCATGFTVANGGNFQLQGGETYTTPTLNSGSTVTFMGSGSTSYTLPNWSYSNLTLNSTSGTNTFNLGADLTVGKNLTISAGTFDATASLYNVTIGGNFTQNGTMTARNNTFTFNDATQNSIITGSGSPAVTFYNLTSTTASKVLRFGAGKTFRINGALTITGTANNQINLSSATPMTQWTINLQGTSSVTYAFVQDSACDGTSLAIALDSTSRNGGNNGTCWGGYPTTQQVRFKGGERIKGSMRIQ